MCKFKSDCGHWAPELCEWYRQHDNRWNRVRDRFGPNARDNFCTHKQLMNRSGSRHAKARDACKRPRMKAREEERRIKAQCDEMDERVLADVEAYTYGAAPYWYYRWDD